MPLNDLITKSGAVYGPDALKAMTTAFDQAWAEVADHFEEGGLEAQAFRYRLAEVILSLATGNSTDPHALKNEALQIVALDRDLVA
jgi:hypothetical protein